MRVAARQQAAMSEILIIPLYAREMVRAGQDASTLADADMPIRWKCSMLHFGVSIFRQN